MTAGHEPIAPASPAPFTPSALVKHFTLRVSNEGTIAFPLIAGAGTLTTIISLRAVYQEANILVGILLNCAIVYIVLRSSSWLELKIGKSGFAVLRRVFGVILLSIAVKIFKTNILPV